MTSLHDFVFTTRFEDLPAAVQRIMERSVLDTLGVAAVGTTTAMGRATADYVRAHHCPGPEGPTARLLFQGQAVSPEGAALASAYAIDSIDAHDGHSPVKGHAGSGIFPALLAFSEDLRNQGKPLSGPDFLAAMAIGYEVAYRAGLALHATTPGLPYIRCLDGSGGSRHGRKTAGTIRRKKCAMPSESPNTTARAAR